MTLKIKKIEVNFESWHEWTLGDTLSDKILVLKISYPMMCQNKPDDIKNNKIDLNFEKYESTLWGRSQRQNFRSW